jgi:hypothetical protein
MTSLSPRAQKLAAVVLLVLGIAMVFRLAVQPVITAFLEQRQNLLRQQDLIAQYQRVAIKRPALQAQLSDLEQGLRSTDIFLAPGVESVVAARLQNRIRALIEENGAVMQSAQVLPAVDEGGFRRIAVRIRLTATVASLNRTAFSLEAGTPYLIIDNIDISSQQILRRTETGKDWDSVFSVLLDVYGYIQPT